MIEKPQVLAPKELYESVKKPYEYIGDSRKKNHRKNEYEKVLSLCYTIMGLLKLNTRSDLSHKYVFLIHHFLYDRKKDKDYRLVDNHNLKDIFKNNLKIDEYSRYIECGPKKYDNISDQLINAFKEKEKLIFHFGEDKLREDIKFSSDNHTNIKKYQSQFHQIVEELNQFKILEAEEYKKDNDKLSMKISFNEHKIEYNQRIKEAFEILEEADLIRKMNYINWNYKIDEPIYKPNKYKLTPKAHNLFKESEEFVSTPRFNITTRFGGDGPVVNGIDAFINIKSDIKYYDKITHPRIRTVIHNYTSKIPKRFKKWWKNILSTGEQYKETDKFMKSLDKLEQQEYFIARISAYKDGLWKADDKLSHLPSYPFRIFYYPLTSGRLQPTPHVYGTKVLRPYLRPSSDIELRNSKLISLDFSKQELRLLTYFSQDDILLNLCNEPDFFDQLLQKVEVTEFEELLREQNVSSEKIKKHKKGAMYSYIYGSQGYNLAKKLFDEYINNFDWDKYTKNEISKKGKEYHKTARNFIGTLEDRLEGVKQYRLEKMVEFRVRGYAEAPGGVRRYIRNDEDYYKSRNKDDYFRQKGLSQFIQGAGAYIARKIIIKSEEADRYNMFLPVHDGFIFYVSNRFDLDEVKEEIKNMMEDCAEDVISDYYSGDISMPVTEEWRTSYNKNDDNMNI